MIVFFAMFVVVCLLICWFVVVLCFMCLFDFVILVRLILLMLYLFVFYLLYYFICVLLSLLCVVLLCCCRHHCSFIPQTGLPVRGPSGLVSGRLTAARPRRVATLVPPASVFIFDPNFHIGSPSASGV